VLIEEGINGDVMGIFGAVFGVTDLRGRSGIV